MAFIFRSSFTETSSKLAKETVEAVPPSGGSLDRFIYGAFQTISNDYENYNSLGLNLWHVYSEEKFSDALHKHTPCGPFSDPTWAWPLADTLLSPVTSYASDLVTILNNIHTHGNSKVVWRRPKIEWLAYGQSSTYKAFQDNPGLWFYEFNSRVGEPFQDIQWNGGKTVLHCGAPQYGPDAGYVLSRLKANTEQSRRHNHWEGDSECDWLIKPRIRADKNYIDNHSDEPICRIDMFNQHGDKFKEVLLRARNFKFGNMYNGDYIEVYNFTGNDLTLNYHGDWAVNDDGWYYKARGEKSVQQENDDPESVIMLTYRFTGMITAICGLIM